jgi:hypothetical protein
MIEADDVVDLEDVTMVLNKGHDRHRVAEKPLLLIKTSVAGGVSTNEKFCAAREKHSALAVVARAGLRRCVPACLHSRAGTVTCGCHQPIPAAEEGEWGSSFRR